MLLEDSDIKVEESRVKVTNYNNTETRTYRTEKHGRNRCSHQQIRDRHCQQAQRISTSSPSKECPYSTHVGHRAWPFPATPRETPPNPSCHPSSASQPRLRPVLDSQPHPYPFTTAPASRPCACMRWRLRARVEPADADRRMSTCMLARAHGYTRMHARMVSLIRQVCRSLSRLLPAPRSSGARTAGRVARARVWVC